MFLLKKLLAPLFYPVPLCGLLLLTGCALLWLGKRPKVARILITTSCILFLFFGYGLYPRFALRYLETRHPPLLDISSLSASDRVKIDWIVVLGGGHNSHPNLPPSSQLNPESIVRVSEAVRLQRQLPQAKILLSSGEIYARESNASMMKKFALSIGVNEAILVTETSGRDTEGEAVALKPLLGDTPFILVTSASHMPRSMGLFRKQGTQPIPAPTYIRTLKGESLFNPGMLYPSSSGFNGSERATHELLGILWAKLRGKI